MWVHCAVPRDEVVMFHPDYIALFDSEGQQRTLEEFLRAMPCTCGEACPREIPTSVGI